MDTLYLIFRGHPGVQLFENPFLSDRELIDVILSNPKVVYQALRGGESLGDPPHCVLLPRHVSTLVEGQATPCEFLLLASEPILTLVVVHRSEAETWHQRVVGTIVDFASNPSEWWTVEGIKQTFQTVCRLQGQDPSAVLEELVGPARPPADYWSQLEHNIREGRVRAVIVTDRISPQLRKVLEFFRHQVRSLEVTAIELHAYGGRDSYVQVLQVAVPIRPQEPEHTAGRVTSTLDVSVTKAPAASGSEDGISPLERIRILVIVEDRTIATAIQHLLDERNYRVEVVPDGIQALHRTAEAKPHIVIVDDDLPRLPGRNLIRIIKQSQHMRTIQALLLTSSLDSLVDHVGYIDAFVLKPFRLDEVLGKVEGLREVAERARRVKIGESR
jgi:CheY-like chemotaxis protein